MWAAMMFLLAAQKMNKGFSKLRQYLILAFRMLAVAAIIFVASRPLAGGLLGLTGGAPDSVIILLDRSASMQEQLLSTGTSKREAALQNLTAAIKDAYGARSKLTVIDSAFLQPVSLENPEALSDLPQTSATDTSADIPGLLQAGLDFITTNETGRTDVWLVSDLRQSDWNSQGGRWQELRDAFNSLQGIRFHVLAYPESKENDMSVVVENAIRRKSSDKSELLVDIRIRRNQPVSSKQTVPLRVVVNGVSSTIEAELEGSEILLQAQSIPLDLTTKRGWGSVELPADGSPADNVYHFVFDDPPPLKSVVVTDDDTVSHPLRAALSAPANQSHTYVCEIVAPERTAEIPWDEVALLVWQEALPEPESHIATQMAAHLDAGRSILFLPPDTPDSTEFQGIRWNQWNETGGKPVLTDWWRNDSGLLNATRAGAALPVGELETQRWCEIEGEFIPLARLGDEANKAPLLAQITHDKGGAYFLATLPGPGSSNFARDGVVLFAMLHRALNAGAETLGNARQRIADAQSLGNNIDAWSRIDIDDPSSVVSLDRPLQAGVLEKESSDRDKPGLLVALNRAPDEDAPQTLAKPVLDELFAGLDWRLIEQSLEDEKSLTSEVWRTFLMLMAAALLFEALLCMPARRQPSVADSI